jgi:anaerobic ribonucleoside-triphosphate reductase
MDNRKEVIEIKNEGRTVCEVWTRVMGYYRPTSAFNKGKQSEYQERRCFSEQKAVKHK